MAFHEEAFEGAVEITAAMMEEAELEFTEESAEKVSAFFAVLYKKLRAVANEEEEVPCRKPGTFEVYKDAAGEYRFQLKAANNQVIAVSEGIKLADGRYVCELSASDQTEDVFGHKQLAGTAQFLAGVCAKRLGIKARAIELSTLQRCAAHISSLTDIDEAYAVGAAAVSAALEGLTGVATTLLRVSSNPYQCTTGTAYISKMANYEKQIPLEWIDVVNADLRKEFLEYARPLIQGELTPVFENGLPKHLILK